MRNVGFSHVDLSEKCQLNNGTKPGGFDDKSRAKAFAMRIQIERQTLVSFLLKR